LWRVVARRRLAEQQRIDQAFSCFDFLLKNIIARPPSCASRQPPQTNFTDGETIMTMLYSYARRSPFDAAFNDVLGALAQRTARPAASVRAIPFEVTEQGANYVVSADLPGFRKEDIAVEIDGARVTITAESKNERSPSEGDRILYTERQVGRAVRSFELGVEIDQDNAVARYVDGVLSLTLPKKVVETRKLLTVQ
jgi:HSP20 family protein